MVKRFFALVLLFGFMSAPSHGAEPARPPPAAGMSGSQLKERAALLAGLQAAKDDAEARAIEDKLWTFWRGFADVESRELLEESRQAQLRFDYEEANFYLKELVKHAPQFAEGWNQLGYNYFLAGQYDASLDAIGHVIALEPMHYAALAGKGIILIQQGKEAEAQGPLGRALAINPWLKERNLVGKDPPPIP
jgi:tetratricopeptide (TPR) repeat protein